MTTDYICGTYSRTILQENKLSGGRWDIPAAEEMLGTASQILEYAKNSLVLRSYNVCYGLTGSHEAYEAKKYKTAALESDGGHVNLMSAIVDCALRYLYGPYMERTDDGYTHQEIAEAVRRHDLGENNTGDPADNGERDEAAKVEVEANYQKWFSELSPSREDEFDRKVRRLLAEMEGKTSPTGKLLYLADKASAIIMTLCYDCIGKSPLRHKDDPWTTRRDLIEINICDFNKDGAYYASEMWTIDFFKTRRLVQYDDTGYFTALIVMATLIVNGCWYNWRKTDYS